MNTPTAEEIKATRTNMGMSRLEFAGHLLDITPEHMEIVRQVATLERSIQLWETDVRSPSPKNLRLLRSRTT